MLRASAICEENGIPALAVVATGFLGQARAVGRALGIGAESLAEYPGLPVNDTDSQIEDKVTAMVIPRFLDWIETRSEPAPAGAAAPRARSGDLRAIAFRGDLDQVQDHFHEHQWSDGLPVVPPTVGRVERFLSHTSRAPDEVIGVLAPEQRELTVWAAAVNGVLAGCRPEYMPTLLAVAEAISDEEFRLEDGGATPGWEPIVTLSGPVAEQLDLNAGVGVLRVGRQANSSIGRYTRLLMRNIAGLRIPPGTLDRSSIGSGLNVAIAEAEDVVAELGWTTYGEDRGIPRSQSAATVQSVMAISPPIYCGGRDPVAMLEPLVKIMGDTCGPWSFTGIWYRRWHPLVVLSPDIARRLATAGWDKDRLRQHLFDSLTIEAHWLEDYPGHVAGEGVSMRDLVARGDAPPEYAASDDPDRRLPILRRAEWTGIVVAGDPLRNQAKVLVNNHHQGPPITRVIEPSVERADA